MESASRFPGKFCVESVRIRKLRWWRPTYRKFSGTFLHNRKSALEMIKCVRIISAKDLERHKQYTSNEGKLPSQGRIIESVVEGI